MSKVCFDSVRARRYATLRTPRRSLLRSSCTRAWSVVALSGTRVVARTGHANLHFVSRPKMAKAIRSAVRLRIRRSNAHMRDYVQQARERMMVGSVQPIP